MTKHNTPNKITAWATRDGMTHFDGGTLFPSGVQEEYTKTTITTKLAEALKELTTCVEDGCYCSEMRMAAAVDEANEALKQVVIVTKEQHLG